MKQIQATAETKQIIAHFEQFVLEHEYTPQTATGYVRYIKRFLESTSQSDTPVLQKRIAEYLDQVKAVNPGTFKYHRAALYVYFKFIERRCFPKHQPNKTALEVEAILKGFCDYSVNVKLIKPGSAEWEVSCVQRFLEYISRDKLSRTESIDAFDIRDYVVNRLSHLNDSSKGRSVTAIRNFFKYQKFQGASVHDSIFKLPLSPAVWKNSAFPKTICGEAFNGLHEIPNVNKPTGKRDRCIILCFTELALRCIEVANLCIDDFNWQERYVAVRNTKNGSDRKLPVTDKLFSAVVDYLKYARPQTSSRILFVRFKHTCGEPMGGEQIRGVVRRVYAKCGTEIKSTGTHILRRTAATKLYNAGNSLKATADILGHESLDSTVYYAKADIEGLRQVAASWSASTGAGVSSCWMHPKKVDTEEKKKYNKREHERSCVYGQPKPAV